VGKIIKALLTTSSASIIAIVLGMITTKIIASVTGPSGVGLYSLLRQALQMGMTVSSCGGQTALIQGIARKEGDAKNSYLRSVFWMFVIGVVVVTIVLIMSAPWLAEKLFVNQDGNFGVLTQQLAVPVILATISIFLSSVLNGYKAIVRLAIGQIIAALTSVLLAFPVSQAVSDGYLSAFIWIMTVSQMAIATFYLYVACREGWVQSIFTSFPVIRLEDSRHFFRIAGVTLLTSTIAIGSLLAVRTTIVDFMGLAEAGVFDAAWMISTTYVMLLLSSFTTYYLPTLSETKSNAEASRLILMLFKLSVLILVPMIVSLVALKPFIITLLYSDSFSGALPILRWMLIGDYFKVCAWVFSMPLIAFSNPKMLLWTGLFWWVGYYLLALIGVQYIQDMEVLGVSFFILYVIYFAFLASYVGRKYELAIPRIMVFQWCFGLLLILTVSWYYWSIESVEFTSSIIWIIISLVFSLQMLTGVERKKIAEFIFKKVKFS